MPLVVYTGKQTADSQIVEAIACADFMEDHRDGVREALKGGG